MSMPDDVMDPEIEPEQGAVDVIDPPAFKDPGPPGRALATRPAMDLMGTDVEAALAAWHDYQRLTTELLEPSDYQSQGRDRFKKKSAWRKYARAFNISDHVTHEEIVRDAYGWPSRARIRVEAYHPATGRRSEAGHEAHLNERCCLAAYDEPCPKMNYERHDCCPPGCSGRRHWSHPGDVTETALTRAKNRAIADLIGAGEVSAEEMGPDRDGDPTGRASRRAPQRAGASQSRRADGTAQAPASGPPRASEGQATAIAAMIKRLAKLNRDAAVALAPALQASYPHAVVVPAGGRKTFDPARLTRDEAEEVKSLLREAIEGETEGAAQGSPTDSSETGAVASIESGNGKEEPASPLK